MGSPAAGRVLQAEGLAALGHVIAPWSPCWVPPRSYRLGTGDRRSGDGGQGPNHPQEGGSSREATLSRSICRIRFRGAIVAIFSLNVESIFPPVTKVVLCLYHQPLKWGQWEGNIWNMRFAMDL